MPCSANIARLESHVENVGYYTVEGFGGLGFRVLAVAGLNFRLQFFFFFTARCAKTLFGSLCNSIGTDSGPHNISCDELRDANLGVEVTGFLLRD